MADIQVIRIEDILSGVKLQVSNANTRAVAPATDRRLQAPGKTLLDDVCSALTDQYRTSRWYPRATDSSMAQHLPHIIFTAMLRAVLMTWDNQDPAATLGQRLAYAETLGEAFGVAPTHTEQFLLRAMLRNSDTLAELQAQRDAIATNCWPPILPQHFAQAEGHAAWRSAVLQELESAIQQQAALPTFNALLRVEVVGAAGLEAQKKMFGHCWVPFQPPINTYAAVWLSEEGGRASRAVMMGRGARTAVVQDSASPVWNASLPPLVVRSESTQLYVVVNDKKAAKSSDAAGGAMVGKAGVRLQGLQPGLKQRLELSLFGGRSGGCFSCGGVEDDEADASTDLAPEAPESPGDAPQGRSTHSDGTLMQHGSWVMYNPETGEVAGTANRDVRGSITLQLQYLVERRGGLAVESIGHRNREDRVTHSQSSQLGTFGGSLARMLDQSQVEILLKHRHRQAKTARTEILSDVSMLHNGKVSDTPGHQMAPDVADVNDAFRDLASALWHLWRDGKLQGLCGLPRPDAWGGLGPIMAAARTPLQNALKEAPVQACLPFGPGLDVLQLFGRLFCVRPQMVQLVVVQYLLQSWSSSLAYLQALCRLWEPCLMWLSHGLLTEVEVEGVKGIQGLLLQHAIPTLTHHYTAFTKKESVQCFLLLFEVVGWALTWDPRHETPLPLLAEYIATAATGRLLREMQPAVDNLQHSAAELQLEVECASEDLLRDLEIQAALPGLEHFVGRNVSLRYRTLVDHWETLFMYQPGANGAVMTALLGLEEAILEHHSLLGTHGLTAATGANGAPQAAGEAAGQDVIELWGIEEAMTRALERWIVAGVADLRQQVERLVALEVWQPSTGTMGVANSALELFRSIQASMDVWLHQVVRADRDTRRRPVLGRTILKHVRDLITMYLNACKAAWEKELQSRLLPPVPGSGFAVEEAAGGTKPKHRRGATSGHPSEAAFSGASTINVNRSVIVPGRPNFSGPGSVTATGPGHQHNISRALMAGLDKLGLGDFASKEVLSVEPGVVLSSAMCYVRSSLHLMADECHDLEEALTSLVAGQQVEHWTSALLNRASNGNRGGPPSRAVGGQNRSSGGGPAPGTLVAALQATVAAMLADYCAHFRASIVRLVMGACGKPKELMTQMLEGVLTAIHDELELMVASLADATLLGELAEAAWGASLEALQALVLNQAGFRPLTEEEADLGHELVIGLQDLFGETVQSAVPRSSVLATADGRVATSAYVSSLLQCCTASTEDLRDLYLARQACLAATPASTSGAADSSPTSSPPSGPSLLDLLRLLRQRRAAKKADEPAVQFVWEQSKVVAVNVLQMVFELPLSERLVASSTCLLPGTPEGSLFLTKNHLCFTTLLDSDLRTTTDTTLAVKLRDLADMRRGEASDVLELVGTRGKLYVLSGFAAGERDRMLHLLRGDIFASATAMISTGIGGMMGALRNLGARAVTPPPGRPQPAEAAAPGALGVGAAGGPVEAASSSSQRFTDQDQQPPAAAAARPHARSGHGAQQSVTVSAPVMSVSCTLYSKLRDKEGTLQLYSKRAEFVPQPPAQRAPLVILLEDVEHVGTHRDILEDMWLTVQVEGQKDPIRFGHMAEGVLAQLKQNMSELIQQL